MVASLLKFGANIEATDNDNSTPLHGAADNGALASVTLLVEHGANIHASDNLGRCACIYIKYFFLKKILSVFYSFFEVFDIVWKINNVVCELL